MTATIRTLRFCIAAAFSATLLAAASSALADPMKPHGSKGHGVPGHGHGKPMIGEPAKATPATRTVEIILQDNFYEPKSVTVKAGETVRFVLKNKGTLLHEFNIGTPPMHAHHQKEMMTMMEHGMLTATGVNHQMMKMDHSKMGMAPMMKHDDPNSVLVEPGKTKELVWKFDGDAALEFACNIPGHYQLGMVGNIKFRR
jgi:uncharacterized cupredoxin-like copper-binding protein